MHTTIPHVTQSASQFVIRLMVQVSAAILVLMPFHAFLTVWAASFVGQYVALRLWKEGLLVLLVLGLCYLIIYEPKIRRLLAHDLLVRLVCLYIAVLIIAGVIGLLVSTVTARAFAQGLLLDSRFLVFFVVVWVVTQYDDVIARAWKRLLLLPAAVVVGLATLQYSLLPIDFLRHFGYGPDTIPAVSTIDQKDAYQRVQSTLRGANPLGAYLVIILSALGAIIIKVKRLGYRWALFFILSSLALVFTFSRSAWLGVLASMAWLVWTVATSPRARKILLIAGAVATIVFAATLYMLRDNDRFQNVFFHTDEKSQSSESSNYGRLNALQDGVADLVTEPWGGGTGTAGPASAYNDADDSSARIAENYYLQIGQEVGVVGLGLFVAINVVVVRRLWQRRQSMLPQVLLASFVGIFVVNLVSHGWTDDTLAYVWWGLAGAAIAPRVKNSETSV
jgi:hypothetical protein